MWVVLGSSFCEYELWWYSLFVKNSAHLDSPFDIYSQNTVCTHRCVHKKSNKTSIPSRSHFGKFFYIYGEYMFSLQNKVHIQSFLYDFIDSWSQINRRTYDVLRRCCAQEVLRSVSVALKDIKCFRPNFHLSVENEVFDHLIIYVLPL